LTIGGHSPVDSRGLGQDGARAVLDIRSDFGHTQIRPVGEGRFGHIQVSPVGGRTWCVCGHTQIWPVGGGAGARPLLRPLLRPACLPGVRGGHGGHVGRRGCWESRFGHRIFRHGQFVGPGQVLDTLKSHQLVERDWTYPNPASWRTAATNLERPHRRACLRSASVRQQSDDPAQRLRTPLSET
jgi:hypothetical protein